MRAKTLSQGGFSVIELLISLAAFALVLAGLMVLFDNSALLARAQTQVAVMQQSQRVAHSEIVRFARSAGLGGLPVTTLNIPDGGDPPPPAPDGTPDWFENVDAFTYDDNPVFPENGIAVAVLSNVNLQGLVSISNVNVRNPPPCDPDPAVNPLNDCVLPGSDVLIVRGVFSTPLFYLDPPLNVRDWLVDNDLEDESLTLRGKMRMAGRIVQDYPQDLEALAEVLETALAEGRGEAFILRDTINPNAYLVMEFDTDTTNAELERVKCTDVPAGVDPADVPLCMTFKVRLHDTSDGSDDPYAELASGSLIWGTDGPAHGDVRIPANIGSIGLLEEYRFFIRIKWQERPGLPARLAPVLSRARFLPGDIQVGPIVDIAENVIDLQIAVGVDTDAIGSGPGYGQIQEGTVANPAPSANDEILFNHPDDYNPITGLYTPPPGHVTWFHPDLDFTFLRINTLVESAEPERGFQAPPLGLIEDYNRGTAFSVPGGPESPIDYNSEDRRRYRRRWIRTVVELRNLM